MSKESDRQAAGDRKPPLKWVTKDELRPGDLLFSSSEMAGLLGKIIWLGQVLDGVGYSHCAIYDGKNVLETKLKEGVEATPIDEALSRNTYTDIHRFLASDGESELGDEDWPHRPVTRCANGFLGQRYAVSDAVAAALLVIVRRSVFADRPTSDLIRTVLDRAVRDLHDLASEDPPACHLTCSEFLYRSFNDAFPSKKYLIAVVEKPYDSVRLPSIEGHKLLDDDLIEIPIYDSMRFARGAQLPRAKGVDQQPKVADEIRELAAEFETRYAQVNLGSAPILVPSGFSPNGNKTFNIKFETVADYVSPGDLVNSHNTREIGRIEKPSI